MAGPEEFEPLFKMNRLGPSVAPTLPLPVKFRPVFYDPNLVDEMPKADDDDSENFDLDLKITDEGSTGKIFFKDPLCPPDLIVAETEAEDDSSSSRKLGRNMRACHVGLRMHRNKSILDIMNERKRLLEQQKEQQRDYSKELHSEQAAATLVNDLLQNGFHISAPSSTPRAQKSSATSPTAKTPPVSLTDDENQLGPVEEDKLIVAMHKELKRMQHVTD